ncbi:MAG: hypothetical protein ACRECY_07525, partial [Phyllobacterium sp.]
MKLHLRARLGGRRSPLRAAAARFGQTKTKRICVGGEILGGDIVATKLMEMTASEIAAWRGPNRQRHLPCPPHRGASEALAWPPSRPGHGALT